MNVLSNICKNCGTEFTDKFCNHCGEKFYTEHDRSFKHLFEEVLHFLTHFEGSFFITIKTMLASPGKFAWDFCYGIRKRYFKPISFFLMLVIVYLLFPVFEGLNMKLHFYTENKLYGAYASEQISKVKEVKKYTEEELEEAYKHKGEKTSKFLLFSVIPFMALISYALGFRKRKYYFDHFIFATEASSFFILFGFLILPFLILLLSKMGIHLLTEDWQIGAFVYTVFGIYTGLACRRFFGFKKFYSMLYAFLFSAMLFVFIQFIYKFILFFITIHLV
jgi:hypothetical protein